MKTAIVSKDGIIASIYDGEPRQSEYGGPWGNPEQFDHIQIPDELDSSLAKAVVSEDGSISLVVDPDKVQVSRNAKLVALRALRDEKMKQVDTLVNDLALGDTTKTAEEIKVFRQALKDVTTPYKYANDSSKAKAAIDGVDLGSFNWPVI